MSKIGKQQLHIPEGITVTISDTELVFTNNKETLRVPALEGVKPVLEERVLRFELLKNTKQARSNWGTNAALAKNAIRGLQEPFIKELVIEGVGFRVEKEGEGLVFNLGYSHPVKFFPPQGVTLEAEKLTVRVKGVNRELVGRVAAEIRALRKPEPYKGKGIRYRDEVIRRKAGKKAVGAS